MTKICDPFLTVYFKIYFLKLHDLEYLGIASPNGVIILLLKCSAVLLVNVQA